MSEYTCYLNKIVNIELRERYSLPHCPALLGIALQHSHDKFSNATWNQVISFPMEFRITCQDTALDSGASVIDIRVCVWMLYTENLGE